MKRTCSDPFFFLRFGDFDFLLLFFFLFGDGGRFSLFARGECGGDLGGGGGGRFSLFARGECGGDLGGGGGRRFSLFARGEGGGDLGGGSPIGNNVGVNVTR
jgi:hypothetical protein